MKVCKFLLNEINFISSRICPCCSKNLEDEEIVKKYFIRPNPSSSVEVLDEYLKLREKYISMYKQGEIPDFCVNCNDYNPVELSESNSFSGIWVNNKSTCHCRCVYCCLAGEDATQEDFDQINNEKTYDMKPILEELSRRNLFAKDTTIFVCGGEPTEHPDEVNFIIDYVRKHNFRLVLFTNAMIFNAALEDALKDLNVEIFCSIDAASKDVYERVKRVKAFDRVTENIRKYSLAAKENPNSYVRLKYLICPPINDNVEELKNFFKLSESFGVTNVVLSIDRFWFERNKNKRVPNSVKECISYFSNQTDFPNINTSIDYCMLHKSYVERALSQKSFLQKIMNLWK